MARLTIFPRLFVANLFKSLVRDKKAPVLGLNGDMKLEGDSVNWGDMNPEGDSGGGDGDNIESNNVSLAL